MCRENILTANAQYLGQETSLHVQRKHRSGRKGSSDNRNISACAEKTVQQTEVYIHDVETSLHVQRKHQTHSIYITIGGNISACAEKTNGEQGADRRFRKHLCMCRENISGA